MITLSGMKWRALSPSHLDLIGHPCSIAFDGTAWRISVNDIWTTREFTSRDEVTTLIAQAFKQAEQECLG